MFRAFVRLLNHPVVLSLIAVFICCGGCLLVLFPHSHPPEMVYGAACQNNLKQFGGALLQYIESNNARYPIRYLGKTPEARDKNRNPSRPGWIYNPFKPYIKNAGVIQCYFINSSDNQLWSEKSDSKEYFASYNYNYARLCGMKEGSVETPEETVTMWDSVNNYLDEQASVQWSANSRTNSISVQVNQTLAMKAFQSNGGDAYRYRSGGNLRKQLLRHGRVDSPVRGNFLWADGHISTTDFDRITWNMVFNLKENHSCYEKPVAKCQFGDTG